MVSFPSSFSVDRVQLLLNLQCLQSHPLLHPLRDLPSILHWATVAGETRRTLNKVLQHIDPRVPDDMLQTLLVFQEQSQQLKTCIDAKIIQRHAKMHLTDFFFFLLPSSF